LLSPGEGKVLLRTSGVVLLRFLFLPADSPGYDIPASKGPWFRSTIYRIGCSPLHIASLSCNMCENMVAGEVGECETRQDTWRIKRTREGQRLTGKAPPTTMGATTEGTRDVDGCDDGRKGREGSQGKKLSLELRLPLSIPPKELGSLDYILSLGHLRCPRTYMRPSLHGAAPQGPKTKGDGRVPPKRGTKWLRNEGRRACDAKMRHNLAQKRR